MNAQALVRVQAPSVPIAAGGVLQRKCACGNHTVAGGECEECKKKRAGTLQRAVSNAAPVDGVPPIVHEVLRSSGRPLDDETRAFMEPRFAHDFSQIPSGTVAEGIQAQLTIGQPNDRYEREAEQVSVRAIRNDVPVDPMQPRYDFSRVKIHTGPAAAASAHAVGAQAYTVGTHIVFGAGNYSPTTSTGQRLLAHELTHVVQQQGLSQYQTLYRQTVTQEATVKDAQTEADDATTSEEADTGSKQEVESSGETEEITIPAVSTGETEECPQLIPQRPLIPEGGSGVTGEANGDDLFSDLLSIAATFPLGGGLLGRIAGKAWSKLPFRIRAFAVNKALDLAITAGRFLPKANFLTGNLLGWLRAGIIGFFKRLRREKDEVKVRIFEKYLRAISGNSTAFIWGYIKGIFEGFFVDGLVGIIQTVVDIVCLVSKFPKLIGVLERFFEVFPDEIKGLATAIASLNRTIGKAFEGAVDEILELVKNPESILEFLNGISEAGEAASDKIGEKAAEALIDISKAPLGSLGKATGRVAGMVLFEVALAALTGGGGAAVTTTKLGVRFAVKFISSTSKLLLPVLDTVRVMLRTIAPTLIKVQKYLTRTPLFKAVAQRLHGAVEAVIDFITAIGKRCRPGSLKCKISKRERRKGKRKQRTKAKDIEWSDNPRSPEYGHSVSEHGPRARKDEGMWSAARTDRGPKGRFFDEKSIVDAEKLTRGQAKGWISGGHYIQEVKMQNVGQVFLPDGRTVVTTHRVRVVREGANPYGRVITSYPVLTESLKNRLRKQGIPIQL